MRHIRMIHMCTRFNKILTYDNCLHDPGGQIDLFISHSRVSFSPLFDQTRLTLRDFFYYCSLACIVCDAFQIVHKNEFPSHSDHNFYHHTQQFAAFLLFFPEWKNFSIIRIKKRRKKNFLGLEGKKYESF